MVQFNPFESRARQTNVVKPDRIVRNSKAYIIKTVTQTKTYQLVFGKGVVDPKTFMTYAYGYRAASNHQYMDNVNVLMIFQ